MSSITYTEYLANLNEFIEKGTKRRLSIDKSIKSIIEGEKFDLIKIQNLTKMKDFTKEEIEEIKKLKLLKIKQEKKQRSLKKNKLLKYTKVNGPISYTRVDYKGKIIHLFGDRHDKKTKCVYDFIDLSELIANTLRNYTDIAIDIFFEIGKYGFDKYRFDKSYLYDTIDFFNEKNCIDRLVNLKCEFFNARFHNIDLRLQIFDEFFKEGYSGKISDILQDSQIIKYLLKMFDKLIKKISDQGIIKLLEFKIKNIYIRFSKNELTLEDEILVELLDIYLILILFREDKYTVNYSIIYLGEYHIQNIISFFKELGVTTDIFNKNVDEKLPQCIYVPTHDQNFLPFEDISKLQYPIKNPDEMQILTVTGYPVWKFKKSKSKKSKSKKSKSKKSKSI